MFSIIIPTYNRCNITLNLVMSLSAQVRDNDEVIVIDDGSDDDTFKVLSTLPFEWLKVYTILNSGGPATPRNIGYHKASNNWVCFLDSDDWWGNGKLDQLRSNLFGKEKEIAFSYHNAIGSKTKRIFGRQLYNKSEIYKFTRNSIVMSSLTINKKYFSDRSFIFDESEKSSSIEDTIFAYELFFYKMPYVYIAQCLSVYAESSFDSISQSHQQLDKLYLYHRSNPYNLSWIKSLIIRSYWKSRLKFSMRRLKGSSQKNKTRNTDALLLIFQMPISIIVLLYTRIYVDKFKIKSKNGNRTAIEDSGLVRYQESLLSNNFK
jgi:glycosyltransferase involved in cell wall biosynthesis